MNKTTYIKFGIILVLIAIISLVSSLLLFNQKNTKKENTISTQDEVIEEEIKITNEYYDYSKFNMDNTFYTYNDDKYSSMIGIDVSEHNLDIEFNKVKDMGIEFVYIRIGWRGYTEGGIYLDNKYYEFINNAKEAGLKVGIYFFSQAINEDEALEEAKFVESTLGDTNIDLPIVYDFENISDDEARTDSLTKEEITNNALTFLKYLEKKHDVMLYGNKYIFDTYYDMDKISDYRIWFAQYHDEPETTLKFSIWQYSDSAKIDGITKETDLNIMLIEK